MKVYLPATYHVYFAHVHPQPMCTGAAAQNAPSRWEPGSALLMGSTALRPKQRVCAVHLACFSLASLYAIIYIP